MAGFITGLILGIATGILLVYLFFRLFFFRIFFLEDKSPFSFIDTCDALRVEAEKNNWKVPMVHDLQETMLKWGKKSVRSGFMNSVSRNLLTKFSLTMRKSWQHP